MRWHGVDPVLLLLVAAGLCGAIFLPFLAQAPNRLISGSPIPFGTALSGWHLVLLMPAAILIPGILAARSASLAAVLAVAALGMAAGLLILAGLEADTQASHAPPSARTSLGSGFWVMLVAALLIFADKLRDLANLWRAVFAIAALVLLTLLLWSGVLSQLSIMREYAGRHEVFSAAVARHFLLVGIAIAGALLVGVPLGAAAYFFPPSRGKIFAFLNLVQTIPSIALFSLLIPPLAALGLGGVGLAPAIIALTLYALLPIARNTASGLDAVPTDVMEAARGMGMTSPQILLHVQTPLAFPVFLSGLRITVVQTIGLAVIAALVGAGGLGAIMFEGLFANALDLMLLGIIPVVLMAVAADTILRLLAPQAA